MDIIECKNMNEAVQNHFDMFKKDFYLSNNLPQDTRTAIYLQDNDKYIIFKDNNIDDTINEWAKEFMKEQKWFENNEVYEE